MEIQNKIREGNFETFYTVLEEASKKASSSNFILVKVLTDKITAADIFDQMVRRKMVIRDAASFTFLDESYLRFCILSPEENARLLKELKAIVE